MTPSDNQPNQTAEMTRARIAVRALAETVYRHGGLAGPVFGGVSAADGQRLHRLFTDHLSDRYPADLIETETSLTLNWPAEPSPGSSVGLTVSGRLDALVSTERPLLIEVKSYSGTPDQLHDGGDPVHWAQASLYAWQWLNLHPDVPRIQITLSYISVETEQWTEWVRTAERSRCEQFFSETCRRYLTFATTMIFGRRERLDSGLRCRFPYPALREGQKAFMREVIGAAREKGTLLVQAPTGIGKTMAALYPAVKALAHQMTDHVFYLTAMTSTRRFAAQAVDDLRRTGLRMKALILYSKESMCLSPDIYCDQQQCPYAIAYYDHLPAALHQLFVYETIDQDAILACAKQHHVCPFELALDMSTYCEIIICDYNYAFDPRVRLERFFGVDAASHLLLVDEAHNLGDRSRSMFSAELEGPLLDTAIEVLKGRCQPLEQSLLRIQTYMTTLRQAIEQDQPAFNQVESKIRENEIMSAEQFRGMRSLPASLIRLLGHMVYQSHEFLSEQPEWSLRKPLLDWYFRVLFFLRIADSYYDDTYVTTASVSDGQLRLELMCLDAAEKLAATYRTRHAAVFFSATLHPMHYYQTLLYGYHPEIPPETLTIPSPFPAENLLVMTCGTLSTRYRQRSETIEGIRNMIVAAVSARTGNYLIYLPSFTYLSQMRQLLRAARPDLQADYMFQRREMSDRLRHKFLDRFNTYGQRTLLAFAVIGGLFSEGIDLTGDKLSGVIIVGVGLPQIAPEREIMRQYYDQLTRAGYAHAYLYPGFNRVQQAAGRVIRSETDRGFVLLIDDRYDQESYHQLYPMEWQPRPVIDRTDLTVHLQAFWGEDPANSPAAASAYPVDDTVSPSDESGTGGITE